jgi:hypothetical protein
MMAPHTPFAMYDFSPSWRPSPRLPTRRLAQSARRVECSPTLQAKTKKVSMLSRNTSLWNAAKGEAMLPSLTMPTVVSNFTIETNVKSGFRGALFAPLRVGVPPPR